MTLNLYMKDRKQVQFWRQFLSMVTQGPTILEVRVISAKQDCLKIIFASHWTKKVWSSHVADDITKAQCIPSHSVLICGGGRLSPSWKLLFTFNTESIILVKIQSETHKTLIYLIQSELTERWTVFNWTSSTFSHSGPNNLGDMSSAKNMHPQNA